MSVQAVILVASMTPVQMGICPDDTTSMAVSPFSLAWRLNTTGDVTVEPGPAELIKQSVELVRRLAVLPIIEEDERAVDELVRKKSRSSTGRSRPITRRS